MTVSTAERRSWSYDEDEPSRALPGGSGPGGKARFSPNVDITVDTAASNAAAAGRDDTGDTENSAGDGSDDRTSSPTSVADFSSADGGTGNIFRVTEDGDRGRSEQQVGASSLKPHGRSAVGPHAMSGAEALQPLNRTGGGSGQAGSGQAQVATPGGGGGGGMRDDGDARTSAELMSAQALFRGSIPGLTSFGEWTCLLR